MMRYFSLLVLMTVSVYCHAQNVDMLKKVIWQELVALDVPYRDLTIDYSIKYDAVRSQYAFRTNSAIDTGIVSRLSDVANNYLARFDTISVYYDGLIRFDEYVREPFISMTPVVINSSHDELFTAVEIIMVPRGGIKKFEERWLMHLDSLDRIGELGDSDMDHYFSLIIEKDGSILANESSWTNPILRSFIRREKKWQPGIQSGRPVKHRIDLYVPKLYAKEQSFVSEWSGIVTMHMAVPVRIAGFEEVYHGDLSNIDRSRYNVVSVVNDHNKYVAPVIHSGDLKQCEELISQLLNCEHASLGNRFSRIYFYKPLK